jgi:phasin
MSMSEFDKGRKIANETMEKGTAAAEQMTRSFQQSGTAGVEKMREYNLRIIDMARATAEAAFELVRQLAAAQTPSEIIELWTSHARKQFEMFSEQTKDLTALGQKIASESAEPITRSVSQAFKKAS